MVNITDMDDIEEQLKNLDKVNSIINGMKNESLSEAERKQFMKQADNLIKETEDRTVIKWVTILGLNIEMDHLWL